MRCRQVVCWILALVVAAFAGFPAAARDVRFGFTPVLGQTDERSEFQPLMAYLSDAIGQKVDLYVAKNYGDLRTQMEAGEVDIGSFSPFAYVDAVRGGKIRIIAQSVIDGSATYRGIIVTSKDTGIKTLADLRGKRFAFVDPKSASGYVYPRAILVEKGINPDSFFQETLFAGDHMKVIAAVLDGRVDAGATYDGALRIAKAKGMASENLVIVASTDPIPHDAIAVRIGLDEALAKKIQTALVIMDKTEAGRRVIALSKKKLSGHVAAQDSTFDVVRRTAAVAGM